MQNYNVKIIATESIEFSRMLYGASVIRLCPYTTVVVWYGHVMHRVVPIKYKHSRNHWHLVPLLLCVFSVLEQCLQVQQQTLAKDTDWWSRSSGDDNTNFTVQSCVITDVT